MRRSVIFRPSLLLMALLISGWAAAGEPVAETPKADPASLYRHVQFLTSLHPARSYPNLASLDRAAEYIRREFENCSGRVELQRYEVGGRPVQNVIAAFNTGCPKRIVIGAHYDVHGEQPGADDNASGVAGILELARLLPGLESRLEYRIDLVAYTLEELPFFRTPAMGSAVHAQSLKEQGAAVELMICLDMIGYFDDRPRSQKYPVFLMKPFYPNRGDYIALVGRAKEARYLRRLKRAFQAGAELPAVTFTAPFRLPGLDRSDHRYYWKQGYRAVMISDMSFLRNPNYHRPGDTLATLDFLRMAGVINGVVRALLDWDAAEPGPEPDLGPEKTNGRRSNDRIQTLAMGTKH